MAADTCDNVLHSLDGGYHITLMGDRENMLVLRDRYCTGLAVIELFHDRIIRITGFHEKDYPTEYADIILKFIRTYHYRLADDAAFDLGLSIVKIDDEEEYYYTAKELTQHRLRRFMRSGRKVQIIINGIKKSRFSVPKYTRDCVLNLTRARIKKLIVCKKVSAAIDIRDNPFIDAVSVDDSFSGSLNLSRSSVTDIVLGDNCRCNLTMNYSGKCFNLKIGDVYSGVLEIRDSCFHMLEIGYYSYANIKLSENWGKKGIKIGSSFRGNLIADSVYLKDLSVGDDCRGKIFIKSKRSHDKGLKHIELADDFGGELDIGGSQTVESVDIGAKATGKLKISGCPAIKVLRFEEYFTGWSDLSRSGIMYIKARKGCNGEFILLNCRDFTLFELPKDCHPKINIDRTPLEVSRDNDSIYYKFHERRLPDEYFTPLYIQWYKDIKKFFRRRFHA